MTYDYEKAQRNHVYQSQSFTRDWESDRAMFANLSDTELDRCSDALWSAACKQTSSGTNTTSPLGEECAYFSYLLNELFCERTDTEISIGSLY
jgi:hypothetical protein